LPFFASAHMGDDTKVMAVRPAELFRKSLLFIGLRFY
jgi:hypothetical protein